MTQIDTLTDILKARSSCRAFRPDPVDDAVITRIVETARHVPSWCNAQPWQLTLTKGAATDSFRDALAREIAKGTPPAPIWIGRPLTAASTATGGAPAGSSFMTPSGSRNQTVQAALRR